MKLSEKMRKRASVNVPVGGQRLYAWTEEAAKLEAKNEALREMVTYCLRGHYVTEESGNEAHEIFPEYSNMIDALLTGGDE